MTWNKARQMMLRGVLGTALAALIGILMPGIRAASAEELFSVVVHIEYDSGFVYEHAFETGVPASMLASLLERCGRGHQTNRNTVRFYCYAVPE
jgi:hypothetical protein